MNIANYSIMFFDLIVFLSGVLLVSYFYGVQTSLSASYYALQPKYQWLFSAWCVGYSLPLTFVTDSWFVKIAVMCICIVGAAANFRGDKAVDITHKTAAFVAVICSHLAMIYDYQMWRLSLASLLVAAFFFILRQKYNGDWWAEIVTYAATFVAIFSKEVLL